MSFIKEFREFAMRGNVVDMAVGVIIGGAFGKIVSSLVADVFMPVLGILTGGIDFMRSISKPNLHELQTSVRNFTLVFLFQLVT